MEESEEEDYYDPYGTASHVNTCIALPSIWALTSIELLATAEQWRVGSFCIMYCIACPEEQNP